MKGKNVFLFLVMMSSVLCSRTGAQTTFEITRNSFHDPKDIFETPNHGFIIAGSMFDSVSILYDEYGLYKIDSLGNELWTNSFWDSGHDSYATSAFLSSDGNYVFSGRPDGTFQHETTLSKVSPSGNLYWTNVFALTGYSSDLPSHCLETRDNKYVIAVVYHNSFTMPYLSLIKTTSNGSRIWQFNYSDSIQYYLTCNAISQTADSGFILTGRAGFQYCFLLRTDNTGHPLWYKLYEDTTNELSGTSVIETPDRGYMLTCSNSTFSYGHAIIIKTDSLGDTLWTKTITGPEYHFLNSIMQTRDSNFVFTGAVGDINSNSQKLFLLKTNPFGDTLWTRTYSTPSYNLTGIKSIQADDGGLVTVCQSEDFFHSTKIFKTDSNGILNCSQSSSITTLAQNQIQVYNGSISVDSNQSSGSIGFYPHIYPPYTYTNCLSLYSENRPIVNEETFIYPIPSAELLHIKSSSAIRQVKVFSLVGNILITENGKTDIDISSLAPGIYFLHVQTENGFICRKIVRE